MVVDVDVDGEGEGQQWMVFNELDLALLGLG